MLDNYYMDTNAGHNNYWVLKTVFNKIWSPKLTWHITKLVHKNSAHMYNIYIHSRRVIIFYNTCYYNIGVGTGEGGAHSHTFLIEMADVAYKIDMMTLEPTLPYKNKF